MAQSGPPAEPGDDEEDLSSRTDTRIAQRVREVALEKLARDLIKVTKSRLEALCLPEAVLDAVRDAQTIRSAPALQRQIRLIRILLRDREWPLIRSRLDALIRHGVVPAELAATPGSENSVPEIEWVVRLLGEGAPAIDDLLKQHPKADRHHLRTLIRNVHRASAQRRTKAEHALQQCVRSMLRD